MQSFADGVVVVCVFWNFPRRIGGDFQDVITVGYVVYYQILTSKVGAVDISPSRRYSHNVALGAGQGVLLWARIRKYLLDIGETETRLGARYCKTAIDFHQFILVELSHVEMVMRQVVIEEVWSIDWFAGSEIGVSYIFRQKVEA